MSRAVASAPDLAALHDALGCAVTAVVQAWRGDRESASLTLTEAHAASEEAFGRGSPEVDALDVVFAAITQGGPLGDQAAGRDVPPSRPVSEPLPLPRERNLPVKVTSTAPGAGTQQPDPLSPGPARYPYAPPASLLEDPARTAEFRRIVALEAAQALEGLPPDPEGGSR